MCIGDIAFNEQFEKVRVSRERFLDSLNKKEFPNRNIVLPHIPETLMRIICQCLEVDVSKRYSSVRAILNDLSKIDREGLDWQYTNTESEHQWNFEDEKGHTYIVNTSKNDYKDYRVTKNGRKYTPKAKGIRAFLLKLI